MSQSPVREELSPKNQADRLFSALLACTTCGTRRLIPIRPGELILLQHDGGLQRDCPDCRSVQSHRLIRIYS